MRPRTTLLIFMVLLAIFIILTIYDVVMRLEICKASGGYLQHKNAISFECIKEHHDVQILR